MTPHAHRWADGSCSVCGMARETKRRVRRCPSCGYDGTIDTVAAIKREAAAAGWSVKERQEDDGSWSIVSTVLPGLVVAGESREDAWREWPEVVELWASTANEERVKAERAVAQAAAAERDRARSLVAALPWGTTASSVNRKAVLAILAEPSDG